MRQSCTKLPTQFGPVKKAFDQIDLPQQQDLRRSLEQIYADNSQTSNGVLTITKSEPLEVEATRR